jgi:hypothetical protein
VFGQHFGLGHKVIEKLVVGLLCSVVVVVLFSLLICCVPVAIKLFYYTSGESFTKIKEFF